MLLFRSVVKSIPEDTTALEYGRFFPVPIILIVRTRQNVIINVDASYPETIVGADFDTDRKPMRSAFDRFYN